MLHCKQCGILLNIGAPEYKDSGDLVDYVEYADNMYPARYSGKSDKCCNRCAPKKKGLLAKIIRMIKIKLRLSNEIKTIR